MILVWMIVILLAAGILSWILGKGNPQIPRWISLVALLADAVLAITILAGHPVDLSSGWMMEVKNDWIPQFGVSFHMAVDGLSLLMVFLTVFTGILSILASWKHISSRTGFFYFNLMFLLAGITGVFVSLDLVLFYFFWEIMLVPMYFIISIWGYERRLYASYKFFLFTQGSGLLMLLSILGLYFVHGSNTGTYTFDYLQLLGTVMDPTVSKWLMLGLLIGFVVKLPIVPFHTWLPDATTEAPSAGSILLAGLLWNTGAYGIIRFVIPLFPDASQWIAPVALILGIIGILYAAKLAFAQFDLKRLVVYTSISHIGFLLVGLFSFTELAMQGVIIQLVTHTVSLSALLVLAVKLQEQIHTKNINQMGGIWTLAPVMGGFGLLFTMDTVALPGLGNFVAEFLILLGAFQSHVVYGVLASIGVVAAAVYGLRILQKVFYGKNPEFLKMKDFNVREIVVMGSLTIASVFFGLYPQPLLDMTNSTTNKVLPRYAQTTVNTPNEKQLSNTRISLFQSSFRDKKDQTLQSLTSLQLLNAVNPISKTTLKGGKP